MTILAGIGCRLGTPAAPILALLRRAEAQAGQRAAALAAPAFREGEPGLAEAAATAGLALRFVPRETLEALQPLCPTQSEAARRTTGLASIAEACALSAGGQLILPRIDGAGVTCALASLDPLP